MAIILKANKVSLFVSSVLFVFWYHSPNFLDTPRMPHLSFPEAALSSRSLVWQCARHKFLLAQSRICEQRLLASSCLSVCLRGITRIPLDGERIYIKQSHFRPWQALRVQGGWGSQISRQSAHEGGKFVSPTPDRLYPPGIIPGIHFCKSHVAAGRIMWMKNSDTIGNRTRDLPACSAVPQPTVLSRAPLTVWSFMKLDIWTFFVNLPRNFKYQ
jgi:hypothetical protein